MTTRNKLSSLAVTILLAVPLVAMAQENIIITTINRFIDWILWPVFLGAVIIMTLWAGFLFVTAQGDPNKIEAAKKTIIWIVVGIIVAFLAFSMVGLVTSFLGNIGSSTPQSGACCISVEGDPNNPMFSCIVAGSSTDCSGEAGNYMGNGSTCISANPAPTCQFQAATP